jgi:hypothetical protein
MSDTTSDMTSRTMSDIMSLTVSDIAASMPLAASMYHGP